MAGVLLGMVAYMGMVMGKIQANSAAYMGTNTLAAALVALSLVEHFNPATAILQTFYGSVSLYGWWRVTRPCLQAQAEDPSGRRP